MEEILKLIALVIAIILHEIAHGYAAYALGDPTAKERGRLSLNPVNHIDPVGSIIVPALLILSQSGVVLGWAKPVPINYSRLQKPDRDAMLISLAGPAANIVLAVAAIMVSNVVYLFIISSKLYALASLIRLFQYTAIISLFLAFFNLIPIPPLDGSRVLRYVLPANLRNAMDRIEPYGLLLVIVVIYFSGGVIVSFFNFVVLILNMMTVY